LRGGEIVEIRREIRRFGALFDIVISGRGTWAAARYATRASASALAQTIEQRRRMLAFFLQD
jgi:hypothetical protein